jgi:hypothetical protein
MDVKRISAYNDIVFRNKPKGLNNHSLRCKPGGSGANLGEPDANSAAKISTQ